MVLLMFLLISPSEILKVYMKKNSDLNNGTESHIVLNLLNPSVYFYNHSNISNFAKSEQFLKLQQTPCGEELKWKSYFNY